MGKHISLEISTPLEPTDCRVISDAVNGTDENVAEKLRDLTRVGWVYNPDTQSDKRPEERHLRVIRNLRYIHFARAMNKPAEIEFVLDLMKFLAARDPQYRGEGFIGEPDLQFVVDEALENVGLDSKVEATRHKFDFIDVVEPLRPSSSVKKLFVFRQIAAETDPESATRLNVIREAVSDVLSIDYPAIYTRTPENDDRIPLHIEKSVPFATTEITDPRLLEYMRTSFTANIIDPFVELAVPKDEIDISHES
jgi:hypothetical protein